MDSILKIIDGYLPKCSVVVELGCGDGALINAIASRKMPLKRLLAVDYFNSPNNLSPKVEFIKQDLENFDLKGPFDLVILNQVFEHMKNPLGLIEKIKGELSEFGKILIVVPNRRGLNNSARTYLPEHGKHYFLWDKESLEYSLNRLGFICRFYNLHTAGTHHPLLRYIPIIFGIQNPNLICVAMKDIA